MHFSSSSFSLDFASDVEFAFTASLSVGIVALLVCAFVCRPTSDAVSPPRLFQCTSFISTILAAAIVVFASIDQQNVSQATLSWLHRSAVFVWVVSVRVSFGYVCRSVIVLCMLPPLVTEWLRIACIVLYETRNYSYTLFGVELVLTLSQTISVAGVLGWSWLTVNPVNQLFERINEETGDVIPTNYSDEALDMKHSTSAAGRQTIAAQKPSEGAQRKHSHRTPGAAAAAARRQRGAAGEDAATQVARMIPLGRGLEVENSTVETRLLTSSRASHQEKSIVRILWHRWKFQFSALAFVRLSYDLIGLLPALLLRPLVDNLAVAISSPSSKESPQDAASSGVGNINDPLTWQHIHKNFNIVDGRFQSSVVLLGLLVACSLLGTLLRVHYHLKLQKISLYIHGVLADAIYHVSLSRRKYAFGGKSRGDVINYLSVDAQRVSGSIQMVNEVWALPVQTGVALYFLYIQLSFAFLTGLGIVILIIPINVYLAKWIQRVQVNMMLWNDERVLTINEIIKNIIYVKMCGWSPDIEEWVRKPRLEYMMYLRRMKFLDAICVFLWAVTPVLVPLLTFSVYIYLGGQLTPGRTISCLTLFGYLIVPLNAYPWVISGLVEAYVSLCRIQPFLYSSGDEEDGVDSESDGLNQRNHSGKEKAGAKSKNKPSVLSRFGLNRKGMGGSSNQSAGLLDDTDHPAGAEEEELTETESDIGFGEQNEFSGQREYGAGVGRSRGHGKKGGSRNAKQAALLHGKRNTASGGGGGGGGGAGRDAPAATGDKTGKNRFHTSQSDLGSSSETTNGGGGDDESVFVYMEQCNIVYRPMTDGFVASKPPSLLCATEISVDVPVFSPTNVFSLYIPHFKASKGQLVAIVGRAGSGKSSFLDAIADECRVAFANRFTVRRDRMAYVEQQPFIVSGSVRQNVLFGRPYQKQRYEAAIRHVCFEDEVEEMPDGDNSHVGHRGSQLSGGQKYRLALARAYYADRDLYLLDEGLGSLDVSVTKAVIANIFTALARSGKCVIVATHNEELIRAADLVYQCEGGKLSLIGAPSSRPAIPGKLVATQREGGDASPAAKDAATGIPEDDLENSTENKKTVRDSAISEGGALLEDGERGGITLRTVSVYLHKAGLWMCVLVVVLIIGMQITRNAGDWYIAQRSGEPLTASADPTAADMKAATRQLLMALGLVALVNGTLALARGFSFAIAGLRAAKEMHSDLLRHVLRANYMFFCNTPPGRIINRLSRDVYNVDDGLPFMVNLFLAKLFLLFGSIVVIIANSSWVLVLAIVPLSVLYYVVQKPYRYANREVRRLELAVRAPMIDNLRDFVDGGVAIRSMGLEVVMGCLRTARADLNMFLRTEYNSIMLQAWFSLRLEALGVLILVTVGCTTVFYFGTVTNVALLGLALAYVQPLTSYISSVLSSFTETEKQLISVERIRQYLDLRGEEEELNSRALAQAQVSSGNLLNAISVQTPTESSRTFTSVTSGQMRYIATTAVWPLFGTIEFCNVSLRYEPSSPLVLRGLSFRVEAGEKIGIVGRTGAGKTSIFSALLRLVQLEAGSILIDSDDIGRLAPDSLRTRLSILPQNAFTYHGTIRQNLDPFGKHTDDEVAFALQCVEMQYLSPFFVVSEDGSNLSGAQRHLLALARTILQQSCIMLLDEPTSQINKQAEKTLWNVMSTHFRESTILCVTHKMDHIDFFDRLFVMNGGELVAQGTPDELRRDRVWPFTHQ